MLRLRYPDLDASTRTNVWRTMFELAELRLVDFSFDRLGEYELNGRQIRNLTRLAKILNPNGALSEVGVKEILSFGLAIDPAE